MDSVRSAFRKFGMLWSLLAFLICFPLSVCSMGLLGNGLYYPVSPVLRLRYPPISTWHGDWMWPVMIWVGILWSFGFLIAGVVNLLLTKWGLSRAILKAILYVATLWVWALILWFVFLSLSYKP